MNKSKLILFALVAALFMQPVLAMDNDSWSERLTNGFSQGFQVIKSGLRAAKNFVVTKKNEISDAVEAGAVIGAGASAAYGIYSHIPHAVPNPQEAIITTVAKDCGRLLVGVGSAAFSAGRYIWSYATPNRVKAILAAGLAYTAYNRFAIINAIDKKYQPNDGKIVTWQHGQNWSNHVHIRQESADFLHYFYANRYQPVIGEPSNLDIMTAEKEELENDLQMLERFLVYFRVLNYIPFSHGEYNIHQVYAQVRAQYAFNVDELQWTTQQFNAIDTAMQRQLSTSKLQYVTLHLNYTKAAQVWWKLKKLLMRLNMIENVIRSINNNPQSAPRINYNNIQVRSDHNQGSNDLRLNIVNENPPLAPGGPAYQIEI